MTYQRKNPREALKLKLLDERRTVRDNRIQSCEGQAFLAHECAGGLHMNEVFVTRGDVMKVHPLSARERILTQECNCSIVCQRFHWDWGHTRKFRDWYEKIQRERYGDDVMDKYLSRPWSKLSQ